MKVRVVVSMVLEVESDEEAAYTMEVHDKVHKKLEELLDGEVMYTLESSEAE